MKQSLAERFWAKVDRTGGPDACWPWRGARNNEGYGQFRRDGKTVLSHRVACELVGRPIAPQLTGDHLCRRRDCQNPSHIEEVTKRENTLRGTGATARHAKQTACIQGHVFDAENTIVTRDGRRQCRRCRTERDARRPKRDRSVYHAQWYAKRKESAKA